MLQILRRFFILPVLALTLAACGGGPSADDLKATRAAALTELALPTETLPVPTEAITPTPTAGITETSLLTPSLTRTATRPPVVNQPLCDDSAYVSDVTIPDGTVLQPGEGFVKTWSLRNTGTCSWTTAYALDFANGTRMDGVITYIHQAVEPGGAIEISVGLAAPATPGTYTGNWRLKNADGTFFGELVYVQIKVPGSASTAAITNTLEPTATATSS
ncbi:MAG: NBR1-Ig-like domain-containing protein [Anaerolineales bacterium]